jgi:hypothetical protein
MAMSALTRQVIVAAGLAAAAAFAPAGMPEAQQAARDQSRLFPALILSANTQHASDRSPVVLTVDDYKAGVRCRFPGEWRKTADGYSFVVNTPVAADACTGFSSLDGIQQAVVRELQQTAVSHGPKCPDTGTLREPVAQTWDNFRIELGERFLDAEHEKAWIVLTDGTALDLPSPEAYPDWLQQACPERNMAPR